MRLYALLLVAASLVAACRLTAQVPTEEPSRGPDAGTEYSVHGIQSTSCCRKAPLRPGQHRVDSQPRLISLPPWPATAKAGSIENTALSFPPTRIRNPSAEISCFWIPSLTRALPARLRSLITGYHESASFVAPQDGLLAKGTRYLSRENLGTNVVDDLSVVGTRKTLSIGVGAVGNTQPLVATREFWYSPDL